MAKKVSPAAHEGSAAMESSRVERVVISPPKLPVAEFALMGTAPLMVCRFSAKALTSIREKQEMGSTSRKGAQRAAKNFDADFNGARHVAREGGWDGVHAAAFRAAMISACRLVGYKMTLAKMSLFVEPDGFDVVDGVPLVRIISPAPPEMSVMHTRNATGVMDLRARPLWPAWGMRLRVKFDADQFTVDDVTNLLTRVGVQVGIGEGRPDSRASAGMGFGTFRLAEPDEIEAWGTPPASVTRRKR